ncbi:MAG: hypothetical protein Q9226_004830, partial [Calogaya cf. arnoldii]
MGIVQPHSGCFDEASLTDTGETLAVKENATTHFVNDLRIGPRSLGYTLDAHRNPVDGLSWIRV